MRKPTLSLLAAAATALILSACGSTAPADTSAPVETASADGQVAAASCLPDCSGADLRGAVFRRVDISNANFQGADLTGAVFEDIRATNVQFGLANLTNTVFRNVDFSGTDCVNRNASDPSWPPDWRCTGSAVFQGNGRDRFLAGTVFDGARMEGANFTNAFLIGVTLTNSNFDKSSWEGSVIFGEDSYARNTLDSSSFQDALMGSISQASLTGTNFSRAYFYGQDGSIYDSTGTGTIFTDAWIERLFINRTTLIDADFRGATFRSVTEAQDTTFQRANFTGAKVTVLAGVTYESSICPDGKTFSGTGDFNQLCGISN